MSNRDRDAERVSIRNWDDIRSAWLDYIPNHNSPWPIPEHDIHELPSLQGELSAFKSPHQHDIDTETIEHEIVGLRAAVLHEATILVHKASHVLRVMGDEASQGYRTWSRSSAYHSAFFAMRGVLGILGVVVVPSEHRRRDFQIDIWAPRRRKDVGPADSRFAVRIVPRDAVQHKELWSLFHRVLCASKVDGSIWPYAGNDVLKRLSVTDFSIVRHRLHYRSTGWIYNDLSDTSERESLDTLADDVLQLRFLGNPEDAKFPVSLALHILSLGVALLADLGKDTPKVQAEVSRAKTWMRQSAWGCANVFEHDTVGGTA